MKLYKVEIYLPTRKKHSGTSDLNLENSTWKVINNIALINNSLHGLYVDVKHLIKDLASGENVFFGAKLKQAPMLELRLNNMKIKFKDLPLGARFKMKEGGPVYVLLQGYGDGLIAKWEPNPYHSLTQGVFSFVDDNHSLYSQVIFVS